MYKIKNAKEKEENKKHSWNSSLGCWIEIADKLKDL